MQTKLFFTILIICTFLASSVCIAAESEEINEIAEAKAKTKFDHIGLAVYYENEAKEMNAKAGEQKRLLDEYKFTANTMAGKVKISSHTMKLC